MMENVHGDDYGLALEHDNHVGVNGNRAQWRLVEVLEELQNNVELEAKPQERESNGFVEARPLERRERNGYVEALKEHHIRHLIEEQAELYL